MLMSSCLVCEVPVGIPVNVMKAEIVACGSCGQEHEVMDVSAGVKLGLAPEIEEDWGE